MRYSSPPHETESAATSPRIHAFGDDVLAHHDAVGLAELLRRRELSPQEVTAAAIARVARVRQLNAVATDCFAEPRASLEVDVSTAPFPGVPTFVKDNVELAGLPTLYGSRAVPSKPAARDEPLTKLLLAQGLVVLGKSCMPEFGFSPTTEFQQTEPTRNPWNPEYSSGGSSGGAAALVASGAVPIAHGNDGGGSIRIPAAHTGLVGLKPTRGRLPFGALSGRLPLRIISEGVLTRTVRDTAHFYAGVEKQYPRRRLLPIGLVEGPGAKRRRIGLVFDSIAGVRSCPDARAAVDRVAHVLERLGHDVVPLVPPVPEFFIEDFKLYWSFLAFMLRTGGRLTTGPGFDASKLDDLTQGLADYFGQRAFRLPLALIRLGGSSWQYAREFRRFDAVLSPVTGQMVPRLGELSPTVPFEELFARILRHTDFTPLNNATGGPGIAVPAGLSSAGLPIGVHLSAAHGDERTLLELAYELEAELGSPRIDDAMRTHRKKR